MERKALNHYRKKQWISRLAPFLCATGLTRLFQNFYGGVGQVLTFHRVIPDRNGPRIHNHQSLEVSPSHLEQVIQFFDRKGYQFFSLDQVHEALQNGRFDQKFVSFTFDDGYWDVYEYAYPIFKKYNVPFAIYVSTNFPEQTAILWWYMLEEFVLQNDKISFEFNQQFFHFPCKSHDEKERAFAEIRQLILREKDQTRLPQTLQAILGEGFNNLCKDCESMFLTWEQIREMNADPLVTIGAHTKHHYPLSQLKEAHLEEEIIGSKTQIEANIQSKVDHFAYPFGKKSEVSIREFEFVKRAGFKTATTTRIGNVFPNHKQFTEAIPRISINRVTNAEVLTLQVSGLIPCVVNKGKRVVTD